MNGLDDPPASSYGRPTSFQDTAPAALYPGERAVPERDGFLAMAAGDPLVTLAALLQIASLGLPLGRTTKGIALYWPIAAPLLVFAWGGLIIALLVLLRPPTRAGGVLAFAVGALVATLAPLLLLASPASELLDPAGWRAGLWCNLLALGALAIASLRRLAALGARPSARPAEPVADHRPRLDPRLVASTTPLFFGAWVLVFWQLLTRAFDVPQVLLPAPALVAHSLAVGWGVLVGDFVQTVLHAVLIGLAVGSGFGFLTGIAIDRSPFLQRGLMPIAALASTVPLVGIAPIMVMWFGFDWHSKAAVVAVMTFFPMLVNTLAGLGATGAIERDLMRSYGAGYARTLLALRLPVALPFVFGALKVNSTLALIGAIVAEFFGSPTAGLGFRISTEAARLNMGLVWAAILVAALAGSLLYGLIGWAERRATFWHPSVRVGR